MRSYGGMAVATSFTGIDRVDSPSLGFTPLRSGSRSKPLAFVDMQEQRIFSGARLGTSFTLDRPGRPFLFNSCCAHFSQRLFSIPKAELRWTPTTTDQTSGSERNSSRDAFQNSMALAFRMVSEITGFILRLAGTLLGFLRKEESATNKIENDIDDVADLVKGAAKGIKEVAEGLEKVSEVVEKDAESVDKLMDKVKADTKAMHDELEDVMGTLEGSVQGVQAKAAEKKQVASEGTVKEKVPAIQKETQEVNDNTDVRDSLSTASGNAVNPATATTTPSLYASRYSENSTISTYKYTGTDQYQQLERRRWWWAVGCRAALLSLMLEVLVRRVDLMELLNRALFMILSSAFAVAA